MINHNQGPQIHPSPPTDRLSYPHWSPGQHMEETAQGKQLATAPSQACSF